MPAPSPLIVIVGPTAGGKTGLAIELARSLPGGGECISADSMQVYRGMDVGTAKPAPELLRDVPHHLIDIVDPGEEGFTVERWLALAEEAVTAIRARGRTPIVVGGTNLYVRALLEGLFESPEPDPILRASLEQAPLEELRRELSEVDAAAAQRIHPRDRRRTIRAIEIYRQTGRPLSAQQTQWSEDPCADVRPDALVVGLLWPVDAINRRINDRVRAMMREGFLDEVRRIAESGLPFGRQAREAVGYRELLEHLAGERTLEEAVEAIKIRSRRYAKQQRTWLRRFQRLPRSLWIDAAAIPEAIWPERVRIALSHESNNPERG